MKIKIVTRLNPNSNETYFLRINGCMSTYLICHEIKMSQGRYVNLIKKYNTIVARCADYYLFNDKCEIENFIDDLLPYLIMSNLMEG